MKTHDEMVTEWQEDPAFRNAYEALAEEFALFDALFKARTKAGLTQAEVAERMGTKTPAVARLEAGGGSKKHSPSIATLQKYATAVGCRLEIALVPLSQSQRGGQEEHTRRKQESQPKSRPAVRRRGYPAPNTYEAPCCQETDSP
jgi:transcriptional regulator with XRE-family HTH domain